MAESGGQVTDPVEVGGSGAASDIFALCCWLVGWLVGLLGDWLVDWVIGWLAGWLAG